MALHFEYTYFWNLRVNKNGRKLNKGLDLTNEHILCLLTDAGFLGASYGSLLPVTDTFHGQKSHIGPCISAEFYLNSALVICAGGCSESFKVR